MKYYCLNCKIYIDHSTTSDCPVCGSRMINQTKVYWSKKSNVPVVLDIDEVDDDLLYISSDIRPVFPEERLLIEILWNEPFKYKNLLNF